MGLNIDLDIMNDINIKEQLSLMIKVVDREVKKQEIKNKKGEVDLETRVNSIIINSGFRPCGEHVKSVPHHLFFIWIGILDSNRLLYPRIWLRTDVKPVIYYDGNAFLSNSYRKELLKIAELENCTHIEIQNSFYDFYVFNGYVSYDAAFIDFLKFKGKMGLAREYEKKLYIYDVCIDPAFEYFDINRIKGLFYKTDLRRLYLYEIVLRNNLAAASDILRLLVLYHFGGVYVDFDTLPDFNYLFKETDVLIEGGEINRNLIDIIRAEKIISSLEPSNRSYSVRENEYLNACTTYIRNESEFLLERMFNDLNQWDGSLKKFVFPSAHVNTGLISASKNCLAEYNNNILVSHAKSKGIRILFREMMRRYKYIERNGYLFMNDIDKQIEFPKDDYLERLKFYRLDGTNESRNVTLILSGPSFILEVILGLSYSLLSIMPDISPLSISYALREKNIGIGFDNQTMFTLEHVQSSWM